MCWCSLSQTLAGNTPHGELQLNLGAQSGAKPGIPDNVSPPHTIYTVALSLACSQAFCKTEGRKGETALGKTNEKEE